MKRLLAAMLMMACAMPAQAQVARSMQVPHGSGTITVGGTSQIALNGDNSRLWLVCENPIAATEPLYIDFGPNFPATINDVSIELAPGGSLSFLGNSVPTEQINVNAATTGHRFICMAGR